MVSMLKRKILALLLVITMLLGLSSTACAADANSPDQENKMQLTIEQAVNMALNNSKTIAISNLNIERGEEVRDLASDRVKYTPMGPAPTAATLAYNGLLASDIAWNMAKKSKTVEEDKIVYSVFNDYTTVLKAVKGLKYAQDAMKSAQANWNIACLSYQQGVISTYQRDGAEVHYKVAQNALKLAEIELENSYQALNKTLGINITERPVLIEQPGYSILKVDSLETAVTRTMEDNPAIWLADQKTYLAQINRDLYDWTNPAREPYEAANIDINKAQITADDLRQTMRQAIRIIYNNIAKIEEGYASKEQAVKLAEETRRVTKVKYDIGMATATELQGAELDLQKQQNELDALVYQHELLKIAFQKPWAYSASTSSSSTAEQK